MTNWWERVQHAVTRSRQVVVGPQIYTKEKRSDKAVSTDPSWIQSPLYGQPRNIDYSLLEQYEQNTTVQAAINFIVDSVATCEWNIVTDKTMPEVETEIDATAATEFFRGKGWEDSFETVLREVIFDILTYDCGTIVLTYPEFCYDENKTLIKTDFTPISLRARDGRSFMIQTNNYGDILKYWQYSFIRNTAAPIEFNKEEIIYIRESPVSRGPYGTAKLQIISDAADLMNAIQLGHRSEQEQQIAIGGVIRQENINDAEMLKRLSEMYNSMKGEGNRGKWLVVGGDTSVEPITMPNIDDSWVGGVEWYQMVILSIFKTPKTILGFVSSDTNRATSISQSTNFKRNGSATMMSLIESFLTRDVVKKFFDDRLVFRFIREQDISDIAITAETNAKDIASGITTANEIRADRGLEPIEPPVEESKPAFDNSNGESDDAKTPEEKKEKSASIDNLETVAVDDLEDWNDDNEKSVLKELEALYG